MPIKRNRHEAHKERAQKDLQLYGNKILRSEEMRRAFQQKHHKTRREIKRMCKVYCCCNQKGGATDIPAVVTGSLCHDLGILGREKKYGSQEECLRQHPADSVETARKLVGELSEKTEDAISRHMWPFAGSKPPNSLEGAIVSMADKIATFEDYAEAIRRKAAGKPRRR